MTQQIINTLIMGAGFLLLFASAELLYRKFNVKGEYTRKYVHIITGFMTFLFPVLIGNHWLVGLLCLTFLLLLVVSKKMKFLKAIHGVQRKTHGSYLYPVSVYGSYLLYDHYGQLMFFYLPILIMAVSDPVAALSGTIWKSHRSRHNMKTSEYKLKDGSKTFFGTTMFFISAVIASLILVFSMPDMELWKIALLCLCVSLAGAVTEAVSSNGWDNLTVPAVIAAILVLFQEIIF